LIKNCVIICGEIREIKTEVIEGLYNNLEGKEMREWTVKNVKAVNREKIYQQFK